MKKEKVFIGIDVSKLTLDICIVKNTTTSLVIKNNKTDIKKFLNEETKGSSEVYLCIENTGKYGWLITELAPDYLTNFYIINPLHLKRSMGLIRGKNDKIDAVRIAQFIKRNYQEEVCYVRERSLITALKVLLS
jgi:transposase